ncbi:hypothetical protein D3C72_1403500 [compost metagenome]
MAAAPSLTPEALPAVTVPPGFTTGFSAASFSNDVSRGCSSRSKTTERPLASAPSNGMISWANHPAA